MEIYDRNNPSKLDAVVSGSERKSGIFTGQTNKEKHMNMQ